jgi:hypothetical protein
VRRVVAKVEFHCEELFPRVGFIATSLAALKPGGGAVLQQARDSRGMDFLPIVKGEFEGTVTHARLMKRLEPPRPGLV